MILNVFPSKDATMYEEFALKTMNTGIDEILQVSKVLSGSFSTTPVNTRSLIKFDLSNVSASFVNGTIPTSSRFFLKLKATEAKQIPLEYDLYFFPVSESWANGTGRSSNFPISTDGVSWQYRQSNVEWTTSSFAALTTGSWANINGGGTWFTSSFVTQSFTTVTQDINVDVTSIVNDWFQGTYPNEGLIIKRSDSDEQSNIEQGEINFFSVDTNTIFSPRIEVSWTDATSSVTSSTLDIASAVLYPVNLRRQYKEGSIPKIKINSRPRFPTRSFVTSSNYLINTILPTSSYYELRDVTTEDIIISSSQFTQLSNDGTDNYFKFRMEGLQPERYYKFVFKVEDSGGAIEYFDQGYYFKVRR